jgi:hypothetical protein
MDDLDFESEERAASPRHLCPEPPSPPRMFEPYRLGEASEVLSSYPTFARLRSNANETDAEDHQDSTMADDAELDLPGAVLARQDNQNWTPITRSSMALTLALMRRCQRFHPMREKDDESPSEAEDVALAVLVRHVEEPGFEEPIEMGLLQEHDTLKANSEARCQERAGEGVLQVGCKQTCQSPTAEPDDPVRR